MPGQATSSAARPTRTMTGSRALKRAPAVWSKSRSRDFRRDGDAHERGRVRPRDSSGDAACAWCRRPRPARQRQPDPKLEHGRRRALRRALQWGRTSSCTTRRPSLKRRKAGTWSSKSRPCPTARATRARSGLRWPDLHRRRGALPDAQQPGAWHQRPLRIERGSIRAALTLLRGQRQLVGRYWTTPTSGRRLQQRRRRRIQLVPFQVNLLESQKAPIASTIPVEGATGWPTRL